MKKNKFNEIYRNELGELTFQDGGGNWWLTACLFPYHIDICDLQFRLSEDVPTRRVFRPLTHYGHLFDGEVYSTAEYLYMHGLCLPSSVKNTEDQIYDVCKTIKKLI